MEPADRPRGLKFLRPARRKGIVHKSMEPPRIDDIVLDSGGFTVVVVFAIAGALLSVWGASGSNTQVWVLVCYSVPLALALCFGLLRSPRVFGLGVGAVILVFPVQQLLLYKAAYPGRSLLTPLRIEDGIEHITRNGDAFTIHYRAMYRGNTLLAWEPLDIIPHGKPGLVNVNNNPVGVPANPVGRANPGDLVGLLRKDERRELLVTPLRNRLSAYYTKDGPLAELFQAARQHKTPLNVAVLGLGGGTVAGHAEWGDRFTFYESDPIVVELVWNSTKCFTYRSEAETEVTLKRRRVPSPGEITLVPGDVRAELARCAQTYDVLIVDLVCFGGIPVHLITQEAMVRYLASTQDVGLIVFNTSNHHRALRPALSKLAEANNLSGYASHDPSDDAGLGRRPSDWVLLTRKGQGLIAVPNWQSLRLARANQPLWTDALSKRSSFLLQISEWQR